MSSNINQQFVSAAQYNQLDELKNLLSRGAEIHTDDDSALRLACRNGHLEIVKFLVTQGADIHANNDGALIWAAANGHIEVVKFLVLPSAAEETADTSATGTTAVPLVAALASMLQRQVLALGSTGTNLGSATHTQGANVSAGNDGALRCAVRSGNLETVKFLIEQGANINADDDYALRWAAEHGHIETVKFLFKQGANIHAKNDEALEGAELNGHHDVCKVLSAFIQEEKLRASANSNVVSGPGVSAVFASTGVQKKHTELKKNKRSKI